MKVQYFGDKHDFRKYALLRRFAGEGGFKIGVCWMLTPDDGRTDGGMRAYLDEGQSSRWRHFDEQLYDLLASQVSKSKLEQRGLEKPTKEDLRLIEDNGLIDGAVYFNDCLTHPSHQELLKDEQLHGLVPDTRIRRYFQKAADLFSHGGANGNEPPSDLIFLDPDNGLEVEAHPINYAKAYKYLYFQEAKKLFDTGKSLLVYQHFPFIKKDVFIPRRVRELSNFLGGCTVKAFETPHVLFLVALQREHEQRFQHVLDFVRHEWPKKENLVWVSERPMA